MPLLDVDILLKPLAVTNVFQRMYVYFSVESSFAGLKLSSYVYRAQTFEGKWVILYFFVSMYKCSFSDVV
jgi:hypothetical protein